MQVNFYKTNDNRNSLYYKYDTDLENKLTYDNCEFKENTNYLYPKLLVHFEYTHLNNLFNLSQYNFCEIISNEDGNKFLIYYFINNFTIIDNSLYEFDLEYCFLLNHQYFIETGLNVILSRSESEYDMRLIDKQLPILDIANTTVRSTGNPNDFDYPNSWNDTDSYGNDNAYAEPNVDFYCIINTVSDESVITKTPHISANGTFIYNINSGCSSFIASFNDLMSILARINKASWSISEFLISNKGECISNIIFIPLKKEVIKDRFQNNKEFIGIDYLPIGSGSLAGSGSGNYNFVVAPITKNKIILDGGFIGLFSSISEDTEHPYETQIRKSSLAFYDIRPYTEYELFIPFYGWYNLDVGKLNDQTSIIKLKYCLNPLTGKSSIQIWECDVSNESLDGDMIINEIQIYSILECQLGVQMPVGSVNTNDMVRNLTSSAISLACGNISGVMGLANAKATVDNTPINATENQTRKAINQYNNAETRFEQNLVTSAGNYISNAIKPISVSSSGNSSGSGFEYYINPLHMAIKKSSYPRLNYDYYDHSFGKPSIFNGKIKNLPKGKFHKASSIIQDASGYPPPRAPMGDILDRIISILKDGFYT